MLYPTDFSRHRPMTEDEAVSAIRMAILLKTRYLRQARWRKNATMEDLLKSFGIDSFAKEVADHLILSNVALFKGPPAAHHSTHGDPRRGSDG